MNNQTLNKVKYTKFLGVIIDEHLTWAEHINTVKTKISRGIAILCKARRVLKTSILVTLYNTLSIHILIIALKYGVELVIIILNLYLKLRKGLLE